MKEKYPISNYRNIIKEFSYYDNVSLENLTNKIDKIEEKCAKDLTYISNYYKRNQHISLNIDLLGEKRKKIVSTFPFINFLPPYMDNTNQNKAIGLKKYKDYLSDITMYIVKVKKANYKIIVENINSITLLLATYIPYDEIISIIKINRNDVEYTFSENGFNLAMKLFTCINKTTQDVLNEFDKVKLHVVIDWIKKNEFYTPKRISVSDTYIARIFCIEFLQIYGYINYYLIANKLKDIFYSYQD